MNIKLNNRGIIAITGQDRSNFLQGLITNDLNLIAQKKILYTALLSAQGRYLFDFFIIEKDNLFLLDVNLSQLESLVQRLNLYKLRSQVECVNVSSQYEVVINTEAQPVGALIDPRHPSLGFRSYVASYASSDTAQADTSPYTDLCLKLGIPSAEDMIASKGIPLECGLDDMGAIAWNKGCYVGQELTARTKHQGLVRKRLLPVTLPCETVPFGTDITLNGNIVGQLRTSHNHQGIGLLRTEALQDAANLSGVFMCGGYTISVNVPDWIKIST